MLSRGRSASKLKRRWAARRGGRFRSAVSSGSSRLEGRSGSSPPSRRSWTSAHSARPGEEDAHQTTRPVGAPRGTQHVPWDRRWQETEGKDTEGPSSGRALGNWGWRAARAEQVGETPWSPTEDSHAGTEVRAGVLEESRNRPRERLQGEKGDFQLEGGRRGGVGQVSSGGQG